jgi:hypothetical protein
MPGRTTGDPDADDIIRRFQRRRKICLWLGGPWFILGFVGALLAGSERISEVDLITLLFAGALVVIPLWVLLYRCPKCGEASSTKDDEGDWSLDPETCRSCGATLKAPRGQ